MTKKYTLINLAFIALALIGLAALIIAKNPAMLFGADEQTKFMRCFDAGDYMTAIGSGTYTAPGDQTPSLIVYVFIGDVADSEELFNQVYSQAIRCAASHPGQWQRIYIIDTMLYPESYFDDNGNVVHGHSITTYSVLRLDFTDARQLAEISDDAALVEAVGKLIRERKANYLSPPFYAPTDVFSLGSFEPWHEGIAKAIKMLHAITGQ